MKTAEKQLKLFYKNGNSAVLRNKIRVRDNKEYSREYHRKNVTQRLARRLFVQYGMTLEEYKQLREKQKARCAICSLHETQSYHGRLHIDHDHKTGKVRGLLCHNCNLSIGRMKEDISIINRALLYVAQGGVY